MIQSHRHLLTSMRKSSRLLDLAEQGETPQEIKQRIIDLFSPYFRNQHVVAEMAVHVLVPRAVNLSRIVHDPWSQSMLERVLEEHRQAELADKAACFKGSADWEGKIAHGTSEHWSAFHLEHPKSELADEEYARELCHNLGVVIEACQQPLLKELLLHVRIRRGKADPGVGLESLDFGLAVGELHDTSGYPGLFAPPPWGVRLNQWRNMAQHHTVRVEASEIIGTYGKAPKEKEIRLKRSELWDVVQKAYMVFMILSTARSIFLLDNLDEFSAYAKAAPVRTEVRILEFASSVALQGFELTDITIGTDSVAAVVTDVTDAPPHERMIHGSQLVYSLWSHFPVKDISLSYHDKQGTHLLTAAVSGTDCDELSRDVIPFSESEMANRVKLAFSEAGASHAAKLVATTA